MDTDNNRQEMQEIWKKFNKQGGTGSVKTAPELTPEEEKKRNRKQIGLYLLITFALQSPGYDFQCDVSPGGRRFAHPPAY